MTQVVHLLDGPCDRSAPVPPWLHREPVNTHDVVAAMLQRQDPGRPRALIERELPMLSSPCLNRVGALLDGP